MSNARLPDRQLKAASNVSHELGELSPAERDFLARRMPVQTLAESYAAANRPVTDAPALIEWDVMHGALMELHSVAHRFFLLKRRAPNSPVAEAADALFAIEIKLREALK